MKVLVSVWFIALLFTFSSCESQVEETPSDFGFDYQPLEIGLFWIYEVDQITYFGENDSENENFFYRDLIRTFFLNDEGEQVFVVSRSKSSDKTTWAAQLEYTLLLRDFKLLKTIENQSVVNLVFPPELGKTWDGNIYRDRPEDEFMIDSVAYNPGSGAGSLNIVRVNQEDSDDKITYRDIRFEVYEKGLGMIEKYEEVLTYCSRNDCLGDELIDGGIQVYMKLVDNGKQ